MQRGLKSVDSLATRSLMELYQTILALVEMDLSLSELLMTPSLSAVMR